LATSVALRCRTLGFRVQSPLYSKKHITRRFLEKLSILYYAYFIIIYA